MFDAVVLQLGQSLDDSVSRFKFSGVIPGSKGFGTISGPMEWLEKSRLVIRCAIANRFEQPIQSFTQANRFKAYALDVGLLNAMLGVPIEVKASNRERRQKDADLAALPRLQAG